MASDPRSEPEAPRPQGLLQVVASVLAAFFGVQSRRNRERDFTNGRALPFIIVGLVLTAAFVAALIVLVQSILPASPPAG